MSKDGGSFPDRFHHHSLPGYPDPPPDEWGDWDEYRDDRDPGYRVRDVEENELMREIALNERQGRGSIASHVACSAPPPHSYCAVIGPSNP